MPVAIFISSLQKELAAERRAMKGLTLRQAQGRPSPPGHGFHVNERGQTRDTIGPTARREVIRRLLAPNLEIAGREAAGDGRA